MRTDARFLCSRARLASVSRRAAALYSRVCAHGTLLRSFRPAAVFLTRSTTPSGARPLSRKTLLPLFTNATVHINSPFVFFICQSQTENPTRSRVDPLSPTPGFLFFLPNYAGSAFFAFLAVFLLCGHAAANMPLRLVGV